MNHRERRSWLKEIRGLIEVQREQKLQEVLAQVQAIQESRRDE
jgi:hypothetical protein